MKKDLWVMKHSMWANTPHLDAMRQLLWTPGGQQTAPVGQQTAPEGNQTISLSPGGQPNNPMGNETAPVGIETTSASVGHETTLAGNEAAPVCHEAACDQSNSPWAMK